MLLGKGVAIGRTDQQKNGQRIGFLLELWLPYVSQYGDVRVTGVAQLAEVYY